MRDMFIEIGDKTFEAWMGFIKFFSRSKGYGYIEVPGHPDIRYEADALHFPRLGISHPATGESVDLDRVRVFPDTPVIFRKPESGCNGGFWTDVIFPQEDYFLVEKELAKRPVYRVVHTDGRFKGQFGAGATHENVYVEGTREQIEAKHTRLTANDPLAPFYKTGPISVQTRWQRKNADGSWVDCKDPRSFPANVLRIQVRVLEAVDQKPHQRFYGHLGELIERSSEFLGDQYSFEIRTGTVDWTEVADPRKKRETATVAQPVSSSAQPNRKPAEKPTAPKTSVAMPKSDKQRPTVIHDLSALTLPTA